MIHTRALPRPVKVGASVVAVAGTFALAGCAGGAADAETPGAAASTAPSSATEPSTAASADAGSTGSSTYADGTYTAEGSYQTPESVEQITVTVTLADDVVTAVEVTGDPQKAESRQYQSQFIGGISDVVVGKNIDELSVSRVAGSSLTSNGFNQAIDSIKSEAAA